MKISYHVSHEQFSPGELLALVQRAEQAAFGGAENAIAAGFITTPSAGNSASASSPGSPSK